jgi:hypothetical protein
MGHCTWRPRGCAVFLLVSCGLFASPLRAGGTMEQLIPDCGALIVQGRYDVIVATVADVRDSGSTNANPPRVVLKVEDVLRGHVPLGSRESLWRPYDHDVDYAFGDAERRIAEWSATPLSGPRVGDRLILIGNMREDSVWRVSARCRDSYSRTNREALISNIRSYEEFARQETEKEERLFAEEQAEDQRILATADIKAMCRLSTDVLVGSFTGSSAGGQRLTAEARVLRWLRSSSAAPRPKGSIWVSMTDREKPHYFRRVDRPQHRQYQRGHFAPDSFLFFLETGPIGNWGFGAMDSENVYRLVDAPNGVIPASRSAVRRVEVELSTGTIAGQPPPRPPECGASFSSFRMLDLSMLGKVQGKITTLRPYTYSERTQALVFGCTDTDPSALWFLPCALPFDRYIHEYAAGGHAVEMSPDALRALIDSLSHIPCVRRNESARDGVATLALRGVIDGSERIFEIAIDDPTLRRVVAMMGDVVRRDTAARWHLNYWKKSFGDGFEPDTVFQYGGPR